MLEGMDPEEYITLIDQTLDQLQAGTGESGDPLQKEHAPSCDSGPSYAAC